MNNKKTKHKLKRALLSMLSLLMLFSSILPAFTSVADAYSPPSTITGSAYVSFFENANNNPALAGTQITRFYVSMPDGKTYIGECLDHGKHAPVDGTYNFTGTLQSDGSYYINLHTSYYASNPSQVSHGESNAFIGAGYTQRVGFAGYRVEPPKGNVKVIKRTKSNKHLTDLVPENYSIKGAVFGLYTDANASSKVGELVTDESGHTNLITEKVHGRYYIQEITAPKGYDIDRTIYPVDIEPGETAVVEIADEPLFDPLSLIIEKKAQEGTDKNLSLEGAEYTVKYYIDTTLTKESVKNATPFRTWVFRTDKDGIIRINDIYKVSGDELFKKENGIPVGLFGTYTIEESKAPKGFARTEGIISIQNITEHSGGSNVAVTSNVVDIEKPQTISLEINKKDAESLQSSPQGYGSLEGAVYEVSIWDMLSNTYTKLAELVTDASGYAKYENGKPGLYMVKETKASKGYLIDENIKKIEAGIRELNTANFNYVVESLEDVTKVEFKKTTTDKNGNIINLAGARVQLVDSDDNLIEEFITTSSPKVIKGLEIGKTYTFREVEAPAGYFKASDEHITIKETKDKQVVTMFDEKIPSIKTTATFDNGAKTSPAEKRVTVKDKVTYKDLIPGKEYLAKAKLVMADDENNIVATGEKTFIPSSSNGYVYVDLTFDASMLEEKSVVVFEDLYKDGKKLASHSDITDKEQTVHFSKVGTKASYIDGTKEKVVSPKMQLKDVMSYSNLKVNKAKVVGILMDKNTKKPYIDADGKEVKAEVSFDVLDGSGEIEILFSFNGLNIDKKTDLVVFEEVYDEEERLIAYHKDFDDEGQSIKAKPVGRIVINEPPKGRNRVDSGDNQNIAIYGLLLASSLVGIITFKKRERK